MISYKPLKITLAEQELDRTDLYTRAGISRSTVQAMLTEGRHVTTETLDKLCQFLDVPISKIIEYIKDDAETDLFV